MTPLCVVLVVLSVLYIVLLFADPIDETGHDEEY